MVKKIFVVKVPPFASQRLEAGAAHGVVEEVEVSLNFGVVGAGGAGGFFEVFVKIGGHALLAAFLIDKGGIQRNAAAMA